MRRAALGAFARTRSGAALGQGTGAAAVLLAIAVLLIAPPASGRTPTEPGYWQTRGSLIVDARGRPVRIAGVSWFGFETPAFAPQGLAERSYKSLLRQVAEHGYDLVRIPFSSQMLDPGSEPQGIDYARNPDLRGLAPIQILDRIVAYAGTLGLRILLDRHRPDAQAQSALWYTPAYPESRWISDWKMLARRYAGTPTVIGADLHDEPHDPACWGCGDVRLDWRLAAERAGNAILSVNPHWLVFVEGVDHYDGSWYWWGGNLEGAKTAPVRLRVPGRLVYSPHDYPASVAAQPWFDSQTYPANLPALWDAEWGYLVRRRIAPVVLGEFGSRLQTPSDRAWLGALVRYLCPTRRCGTSAPGWILWSLNPTSGDTGGLLRDDWRTVDDAKDAALGPIKGMHLSPTKVRDTSNGTSGPGDRRNTPITRTRGRPTARHALITRARGPHAPGTYVGA